MVHTAHGCRGGLAFDVRLKLIAGGGTKVLAQCQPLPSAVQLENWVQVRGLGGNCCRSVNLKSLGDSEWLQLSPEEEESEMENLNLARLPIPPPGRL